MIGDFMCILIPLQLQLVSTTGATGCGAIAAEMDLKAFVAHK
jgi:hypothetical protein